MAGCAGAESVSATALETLLRERVDIRRGGETPAVELATHPSGYAPLDAALPGGGWPLGAVTELLVAAAGIGELSLLLPTLRALTAGEGRDVALVAPPYVPYAPALASAGVVLERLLVVDPPNDGEALWSAERLLESGRYAAVLLWVGRTTPAKQRRLQLAASAGASVGVVYRDADAAADHSPVALRLAVAPAAGALRIELVKVRHGTPRAIYLDAALFDGAQGVPWPIVADAARRRPSRVAPLATRRAPSG